MKYNCIMNKHTLTRTIEIYYTFITNILSIYRNKKCGCWWCIETKLIENLDYQQKRQQISDNLINITKTIINLKKLKQNYK